MAKEILNVDDLPAFIEWYNKKHASNMNLTVASLLNMVRRKIIRVSKGKLDKKTEYDNLMAEFLAECQL